MVAHYGMSEELGPGLLRRRPWSTRSSARGSQASGRPATRPCTTIEAEARKLLGRALAVATAAIGTHRDRLDRLAGALVDRETLEAEELDAVLGPRAREADVVPVEAAVPPTRSARP